jgi:hypothetical protein
MKSPLNPTDDHALFPARFHEWLASGQGRFVVLALAACLSLPATFTSVASIGLDSSWQLSLQLAAMQGKMFGREFVFTYGPLGWLPLHFPVSKLGLLSYDLFIFCSLLSIYRRLLPGRVRFQDALPIIALAIVTKMGLLIAPSSILFNVLCYWLWRVYDKGHPLATACCLASALLLFFSKVNYGLIMVALVPTYGIGLLFLQRHRWIAGILLIIGFPLLVWFGAAIWHVDLPGYLRSAAELISGYNEAMFVPVAKYFLGFEIACLFLLAASFVTLLGRHRLPWRDQVMILPLIGLASLLMFKNAFVRFDEWHNYIFYTAFPLLLAFWCIACHSQREVRMLLFASLLYPLALLIAGTEYFGRDELMQSVPLRYMRAVSKVPWRKNYVDLQQDLRAHFPWVIFSDKMRADIGKSSVDIMPWESSIVILNGLNLKQRPIPQSYSVYTPWLDALNARFISSHEAPDNMLYACAQESAIDARPAAWDESITKRGLLENYTFDSEFKLPMRVSENQKFEPANVFLLKHTPGARQLVPILTNEVNLTLDQPLDIPATTNLVFLTLNVDRTISGRLKSFILSPSLLRVKFQCQDGSSNSYRAILPILKTGVLVNRRVESPDEIRNWLQIKADQNMAVTSICFNAHSPWAFESEFKGTLVEYRFSDNRIVSDSNH